MNDPKDDLNHERATGQFFARRLVRHLLDMGAASAEIPVEYEGAKYNVTVTEIRATQEGRKG